MVGDGSGVRDRRRCRLVLDEHPRCQQWLIERVEHAEWSDEVTCIGLEQNGRLTAVALYEDYTGHDVKMGVAIEKHGATVGWLHAIFRYPFLQLGVRRVTCEVADTNRRSRRLVQKVGFNIEGRKRDALPSGDIIMFGMLRRECRYL